MSIERCGGLIIPVADRVPVSAVRTPFGLSRIDMAVPAGLTLAEIVDIAIPDPAARQFAVVLIGDQAVPREWWCRIKPRPGTRVTVNVVPRGGGGWRIAAMVGVAIASIAIIAATAGAGTPLALGLSGATWGVIGAAAVTIGGTLLINQFLPPPGIEMSGDQGNDQPTYAITGARNRSNHWGKLPFVLGWFRVTPPYGSEPYHETVGADVYWRAIFAVGHGPLAIGQMRIGDTKVENFSGVQIEIRRGYWSMPDRGGWNPATGIFPTIPSFGDTWTAVGPGNTGGFIFAAGQTITFNGLAAATSIYGWDIDQAKPFSLFPSDVHEESLAVEVKNSDGPDIRSSESGADELSVEILFPAGLTHLENSPPGKRSDGRVTLRIEQSPTGTGNWAHVITQEIVGRQTTPLYWGHRWATAGVGAADANKKYDVRVTRVSRDFDNERDIGQTNWIALRTITAASPIAVKGVTFIAVRIKASGQLQGQLNEFNVDVATIARDWDAPSGTWVWRQTNSPAALFRHVLQHPAKTKPLADSQIDLDRLAYWDGVTRPAARNFNGVIESKGSLFDALTKICRIGRAVPTLRGTKASVVIDQPQTVPVRMFTPRNSWSYEGELSHEAVPHAYRVGYVNAARDYTADEVVVYDDGRDATNSTWTERVEFIGIDSNSQAWKEGRFHLAQQRIRREVHRIMVDFEHLACERGDLVALQHDVIAVGLGSARVESITVVAGVVTAVTLDQPIAVDLGKPLAIRARRVVSGAQRTDYYPVTAAVTSSDLFDSVSSVDALPSWDAAGDDVMQFDAVPSVDALPSWDGGGIAIEAARFLLTSHPLIADAPAVGDLVALGIAERETLRVLVRDIEPRADLSARLTLIAEGAGVHTAEFGTIPPYDPVVTIPSGLSAPKIIQIRSDATVMLVTAGRELVTRVVFDFAGAPLAGSTLHILFRPSGTDGGWQEASIQQQGPTSAAIVGVQSGETYDFRLMYSHPDYFTSPAATVDGYRVVGRTGPPQGLKGLNIGLAGGMALLRWDLPADLDVQVGGWIIFRHSPDLENAVWGSTTSIGRGVNGDQTHVYLPLKAGTYMARVYDADGRESIETAAVSTKQASVLEYVPIYDIQENPLFTGEKLLVERVDPDPNNPDDEALQIATGTWDDSPSVDLLPSWDGAGQSVPQNGVYRFALGMDFGTVRRARLTSRMVTAAVNLIDTIDARGNIDDWTDIDGTLGAPVDAQVWGRLTDDNPNVLGARWGAAMRIDSTEITARAVGRLECRLSSADPVFNIRLYELGLVAEEVP